MPQAVYLITSGRFSSLILRLIITCIGSGVTGQLHPRLSYGQFLCLRTLGGGANSMYLDQVVSGAGTTNQVTKRLGQMGAVNNQPFAWVPLTDDGLVAPVVVKLGGPTHCESQPLPATAIRTTSCWSPHPASPCRPREQAATSWSLSNPGRIKLPRLLQD